MVEVEVERLRGVEVLGDVLTWIETVLLSLLDNQYLVGFGG